MMNDCPDGEMRDLLPGYVHGTLSVAERTAVAAHLGACEDCSAEVELIAAAARSFAAPGVDVDRILRALPAAPRGMRATGTRRSFAVGLGRVAAAIGVIAIGAFSVVALRGRFGSQASGTVASAPASAGGSVPTLVAAAPDHRASRVAAESAARASTSHAVARAPAASRVAISFGGGLSDLTDDQLDTLLGELDAIEALPSAEPETHLTPILPPDGGHGAR